MCTHSCMLGLQSLKDKHKLVFRSIFIVLREQQVINAYVTFMNAVIIACMSFDERDISAASERYLGHYPFMSICSCYAWIAVVCNSITQHCFHFAIRVFVCLSMSVLLKRDMSASPRKLPQARNTTPALANNHGGASMSGLLCANGAGGELH